MNLDQKARNRYANFFAIAFVGLFCVTWFTFFEWDMLTGEYWHNDDNAQHVAWMWKWRPDNHFALNDKMNAAAEQLQQWGYWAVSRVAMLVMTPISFAKYMPLTSLLVTCFFTFFIFKKRFGNFLGIAAAILVGFLTFERMVGFNGRAFGFPLLLMFLYFFTQNKWRGTAISLVITSLFYPISLLIELGLVALEGTRLALLHRNNLRQAIITNWKKMSMVAICLLVSIAIPVLKSTQIKADPNIGNMFSSHELLTLPMFGSNLGRVDFNGEVRKLPEVLSNGLQEMQYMLPIIIVCLFILWGQMQQDSSHRQLDLTILYLPVVGIGLMMMARWLLPLLFLPTRYLTYMYPVFFTFLLVRLLSIYTSFFQKWLPGSLLIAVLIIPRFWVHQARNNAQQNYEGYAQIFSKVEELPADNGLIAGPIFICDMIPMHCKRSVLFSYEGFHAIYFKKYWELMSARYFDYLTALTAKDVGVVEDFVRKYDVAYLIIETGFSEHGKSMWNFKPFDKYLEKQLEGNPGRNFALNHLDESFFIKAGDKYRILDCKKWLNR
ncbi:MAG: hypothetical protein GC192_16545 [Bacteroidetes bacterium]|nr:hypothetical protein [Bacteroidota bacterium]